MSIEKSMLLITRQWDKQKSFSLMPVDKSCPYSEGIYDPASKVLVLMSTLTKENYHFVPKLDEDGNKIPRKKRGESGADYKEQRVSIETFQEYYITEKEEIINFINLFCVNSNEFNYQIYMTEPIPTPEVLKNAKLEVVQ